MHKPDPKTAMENLIREARATLPFAVSLASDCEGRCHECPFKLMEFLDTELSDWEIRLQRGEVPSLGDLHWLGRECREVHDVLVSRGVLTLRTGPGVATCESGPA